MTDPLLTWIKRNGVLHGDFLSTTGARIDTYIDVRALAFADETAPLLADAMLELTAHLAYDAVGGPALAAVPIACSMAHTARVQGRHLDTYAVRGSPKPYGRMRRIEGPDLAGRRVLVVDDVCDSGRAALAAVDALQEAKADVAAVAVVVDRGRQGRIRLRNMPLLSLYDAHDLGSP
ncbi:orotate phosphoribosyltransferase [Streptomyces sp. NPDC050658]|uniref:orotate phosphoribosyltransferase n=1 Tax=unclassified Streptomyces TaxID=2593676 RepID=UPI00344363D0